MMIYYLYWLYIFTGIFGWMVPTTSCLASPLSPKPSQQQQQPPPNEEGTPTVNPSSSSSSAASSSRRGDSFEFASNGVCINPSFFYTTPTDGIQQQEQEQQFTMRNVPGDGDCMFLAVALAAATSMGLGGNDLLLRAISRETRSVVAQVFNSTSGTLYIEKDRIVLASSLLRSASKQEGLSPNEYLQQLQKEGCDGGLYGGGPELTVLSNILRRPISIYELAEEEPLPSSSSTSPKPKPKPPTSSLPPNPQNMDRMKEEEKKEPSSSLSVSEAMKEEDTVVDSTTTTGCRIKCMGVFGNPLFADPCLTIPQSAIVSGVQPGAYSWHLHILVLNMSTGTNHDGTSKIEKHACVLLPQSLK